MPYRLDVFDITLTRAFEPPCFAVATNVASLLETLHSTLSKHYPLPLADLQALPGGSMADVGVRVKLFNGILTIETTPEHFSVAAKTLRDRRDLETVLKCAMMSQEAVSNQLDARGFGATTLQVHGWLKRDQDTDESPAKILDGVMPAKKFDLMEGESVSTVPRFRIRSIEGRFNCELAVDESVVPGTQIFFSLVLNVEAKSPFQTTEQIATLAELIVRRWFGYLGIPLPPEEAANAS